MKDWKSGHKDQCRKFQTAKESIIQLNAEPPDLLAAEDQTADPDAMNTEYSI